jgi:hypothetical protein
LFQDQRDNINAAMHRFQKISQARVQALEAERTQIINQIKFYRDQLEDRIKSEKMDASLRELAEQREIQRFIEIEQTRAYDRLMLDRANDRIIHEAVMRRIQLEEQVRRNNTPSGQRP